MFYLIVRIISFRIMNRNTYPKHDAQISFYLRAGTLDQKGLHPKNSPNSSRYHRVFHCFALTFQASDYVIQLRASIVQRYTLL